MLLLLTFWCFDNSRFGFFGPAQCSVKLSRPLDAFQKFSRFPSRHLISWRLGSAIYIYNAVRRHVLYTIRFANLEIDQRNSAAMNRVDDRWISCWHCFGSLWVLVTTNWRCFRLYREGWVVEIFCCFPRYIHTALLNPWIKLILVFCDSYWPFVKVHEGRVSYCRKLEGDKCNGSFGISSQTIGFDEIEPL